MKLFITISFLIMAFTANSETLKFDGKMVVGKNYYGDRLMSGERMVFVWPAIVIESEKISPELKKGITEPYKTFKKRVHEIYEKINVLSDKIELCAKNKKWPESKDCLKEIKYCFGKHQTPCDTWESDKVDKHCGRMRLWECIQTKEPAFDYFKSCFDKENSIGFRFISYGNKNKWEKAVGIKLIGKGYACNFTYLDGELNLIEINNSGGAGDLIEMTLPQNYKWISK